MRAAALLPVLLLAAQAAMAQQTQEVAGALKQNWFDDPFFQVSTGLAACTTPEGPFYTAEERRTQTHSRLERGTSCWLAGKCTDSNAYRYDKPLAPKVRAALLAVPGVRSGSVWVMIQRRWVYLQGCVPTPALARRLERAARAVPDVETVVPDLMTGTRGKPPYPVYPVAGR
ncbi:BON domain-containing protein [Variovorax sp. 770b2]|jgi:osmotically-inducible protein OsmY|uniref:BON domain-containing protein n=1 Tax=Variovorax sp. 770b2 TaxID=1566271 RepID=UPI0008E03C1F|nr:BON domain-containing protein [Variovorax sp. 770b2]SFP75341.1 BON domain-containing protein [Variovorax sp. 770b2]